MKAIQKTAAVIALAALIAGTSAAQAAVFTWANPGTGGSANVGANWDLGTIPTFADSVVLPASVTPYTVTVDSPNSSNNFQLNGGLSIGSNATWEEIDLATNGSGPSTELVGGILNMDAGARLIRRNGSGSTTQWWCNASASSTINADSEYVFGRNIIGFAVPPYSVGTIVIDNPGGANPDYPLGSFTITGDFIVRNGKFAAAWGGANPTNMTCRNFIVDGASSEVRMRNGDIDGTLTITNDLTIRNSGTFRDAAGALVVSQAVPVNIGGDLHIETGGTLANLGGVFDFVLNFNGASPQVFSNNGGASSVAESIVVASGAALEFIDGPTTVDNLTASTVSVSNPGGGSLVGAYTHNENASFATNGTVEINTVALTINLNLNTDVSGLTVDTAVHDWMVHD